VLPASSPPMSEWHRRIIAVPPRFCVPESAKRYSRSNAKPEAPVGWAERDPERGFASPGRTHVHGEVRSLRKAGGPDCSLAPQAGRGEGRASAMTRFVERHPAWALIVIIAIAPALWLIFALWPPGLEEAIGRKRVFLNAVFNGITLGGLYFLVASGFTLIFGLMRNVNLAHGSLYLFGGYVGYAISVWTRSLIFSFTIAFSAVALVRIILPIVSYRRMEGQDLRLTMVAIGLSIVFADPMLWAFGGDFYQIQTPRWLIGPIELPFVTSVKSSGEAVYLLYPLVRLVIFAASAVIGVA